MAGNPANDFDRGRRIAKYEILTRLSVGGMAELYLAYLPGPGGFKKFVALKQILPDVKADDSFVKMFLDEARITAAFNHANIGQVFDLGEDPNSGELYLAMEFIAGQNLEQIVKRAAKLEVPIPVGFAARVVRDACMGLHYAHTFKDPTGQPMAVVHRDVSPKNVMVTYTGQVKMIDFGIAKARGRLNRTQVGIVKGTSGYMSPEQVRNEPLDGRTDLFAAGVMLHELLCGERLFTAPTDAAMMIKIVDEAAKDPTTVNEFVSPAFAQVSLKLLEKNRDQRFANGRDVARAIEQACAGELFEDEQVAEVMAQLFDDKITLTRALLELANEGKDAQSMTQAVQGLTSNEEEGQRKKTGGAPVRSSATPHPRAGVRNAASSQRLPKVGTGQSQKVKPVSASGGKSVRSLPKVAPRQTPPDPPEEETQPPPPPAPARGRSSMKLKPVSPTPPNAQARATAPVPAPEPVTKGGGGFGGLIAVVLVVAVLGGLGWAVTAGPLKDKARELLASETEAPVVDNGPKPIDAAVKPAWVREKEEADRLAAEEAARQKEVEVAANDPERRKLLEEIQAQLQQLNNLEEEQHQLKIDARAGKATGEANSNKIADLQKQIDEMKKALTDKQQKATPVKRSGEAAPGDVQVVRDARSAKNAEVGYLTVRTFNPDSSSVTMEDGTALGSTPLVKVPLDVGVHKLRLIDSEGKARTLSVSIEAGKELKLPAVDVGSLP
jgi:serine/threonine-protein kinase